MLSKAIALAAKEFEGVFDKGGRPYILHCLWVMDRVRHLGDEFMIVAVLHDIVEDTDITVVDLAEMGFSGNVILAVTAITKWPGIAYTDYIEGVELNDIATQVKLRDIEHNSKVTRLKEVEEDDVRRMKKYNQAYTFLKRHRR